MFIRHILTIVYLLLMQQLTAHAQQERIINYDVKIEVQEDRSAIITEFIEVYVGGNIIKRGITRDLPTKRTLHDRRVRMNYEIMEVAKNGDPEPFHKAEGDQSIILYIGQQDVLLDPDVYIYRIKYRATDQIAFYDDYDEIYWNAIGHKNQLPADQASVSLYMPPGAEMIQQSAYTGRYGATGENYTVNEELGGIIYKTTKALRSGEGLTVAVGFQKGYVKPPSFLDKFGTLLIVILGFLTLIPYYVITWWRYGQDPPTPAAVPDWHTPEDKSAASINYIQKGRYDSKSFTASIIDLAIKGYLKIEEQVDSSFLSKKKSFDLVSMKDIGSASDLPSEEKVLHETLFRSKDRVSVAGQYDKTIEQTYAMHKANLQAQHDHFINEGNNTRLLWLPILMTIAIGGLSAFIMVRSVYAPWINIKALIFFGVVGLLGFLLYIYLIRQPTVKKLALRSKIKGHKMYLEMAEKERLNILNPPDLTPTYFESMLPYAFALGVEHKWSNLFKKILEHAQYRPDWHNSANHVHFSNHFGRDFSSNLSRAATPPPPKGGGGGSGGGGFSGGGGGGGGVGGW